VAISGKRHGGSRFRDVLATAPAAEYKAAPRHNKDDDEVNAENDSKGAGGVLELEDFTRGLPLEARLLGIDLGTKTLGLAISDVTRTIASGLTTLAKGKFSEDGRRLLALVEEHRIAGFVLGLPVNLNGTEGPRAQATRAFARNLGRLTSLPILLWDERLTTAAAERALIEADASRRRRAVVIDKVAATLILQGALDRMKRLAGQAQ
jgi:putative holliday junction resolvase